MKTYIILGSLILVAALLIFYTIHMYNRLVTSRNRVLAQWAQIDVQLMRRIELIPNLLETVKGYADHEKEIIDRVSNARTELVRAVLPTEALAANNSLSGQLSNLYAVAEAYPALKSDKAFIDFQSALVETEDKIAYARQFYNDTVLIYQDKLRKFPSNIIASIFKFKGEEFYIVSEDKKRDLKIDEIISGTEKGL